MISLGSPTYMYMTSQKESQVHTAVKIYKKGLIEPHFDYCTAVLDGLLQQLNDINSKNSKITLPKSHCQNHNVVVDNFLTCLIGTTYQ